MRNTVSFTLAEKSYSSPAPIAADGFSVRAEIQEYPAYGAVYERHYIKNTSDTDCTVYKFTDADILLPLNGKAKNTHEISSGTALRVMRMEGTVAGSFYPADDLRSSAEFALTEDFLRRKRTYENKTGRASDGIMPLFDVTNGTDGYIIFLGWNGSWHAEFEAADSGVHAVLRLQNNTFRLPAAETLSTMSTLIMEYHDGQKSARNRFRRLLKEHFSTVGQPGRPAEAMSSFELWGGLSSGEMCRRLDTLKENHIVFDYLWMDAGWYGDYTDECPDPFHSGWSQHTGNWKINPTFHPDGLQDVLAHITEAGMQFELWVEPERCVVTTPPVTEHPEWFTVSGGNALIDYGNPEAWQYVFDTLCSLIDTLQLGCYRQDFNTDCQAFWNCSRSPEEAALAELRHINGLYRLWDALLSKYPHLLIDNCASGGRRFELESIKRTIPFFRSDYQCGFNTDPDVTQCHNTISEYLPYNGCTTKIKSDTYAARSTYSSAWGLACWNCRSQSMNEEDLQWVSRISHEYKLLQPYFSCDYYSLASAGYDKSSWAVWQYDRPEKNDGIILAFRRAASEISLMGFSVSAVKPGMRYILRDMDTDEEWTLSSREFAELTIRIPQKYMSRVILYRSEPT